MSKALRELLFASRGIREAYASESQETLMQKVLGSRHG